jgi:Uma2 family endonuclease
MSASRQILTDIPVNMTVEEFLEWCPDDDQRWELVDGSPRAMAPPKSWHAAIQIEAGRLIGNHLAARGSPCAVIGPSGVVPRVRSKHNLRVPDLLVTCTSLGTNEPSVADPVLIVEILSPSNQNETWANVWTYTTIPSLREILVLRTVTIRADVLRRGPDGHWPESPETVTEGELMLESIDFRAPLAGLYRTTGLAASTQ